MGTDASITLQWVVGSAFHFCNGLAFAVAYSYWFAPKGPLAGIAFAMVLEAFMLGLYPGWLKIAEYAPFLTMSLIGHLVYGAVLGVLARRWWRASGDRQRRASPALWFVGLPRLVARRTRPLAYLLADGHFLVAQPWLAAVATPASLLLGLVWGALTLDYDRVFSESLPLILVACIFGFLSTNLGIAFVTGFALGDFLIGETRWSVEFSAHPEVFANEGLLAALVRIRAPMLIGYLLMFVLAVYIPRLARLLILDIPQTTRLPKNYALAVGSLLNVIVVAVSVRFWAEAAAVLMRPLFTWRFQDPTVAAAYALQMQSGWIVLGAISATCTYRFAVIWAAYLSPPSTQLIMAAENDLARAVPSQKKPKRAGKVTAALVAAAISTAALSGLFDNWLIPVVAFAVFCTLHLLRKGIIPVPMEWWRRQRLRYWSA